MSDDPLDKLPEKYRPYVALLIEKARCEAYYEAKLEDSAVRFGQPTVTQTAPRSDKRLEAKLFADGAAAGAIVRRVKSRKRTGKAKARQAEKFVREFFETGRVENATAKDALLAVADKVAIPLDFTEVGRALRDLAKHGVLTQTGPKTWSLTAAMTRATP